MVASLVFFQRFVALALFSLHYLSKACSLQCLHCVFVVATDCMCKGSTVAVNYEQIAIKPHTASWQVRATGELGQVNQVIATSYDAGQTTWITTADG